MDINKIKAPENLKAQTINLMENELNKHNSDKFKLNKKLGLKSIASVAIICLIVVFSGFAQDYFSGIGGDELIFNSHYEGDGIVCIEVENKSNKNLQFTSGILRSWNDNEDLVYLNEKGDKDLPFINVKMPLIKGGEKKTITIDLSSCDYKKFESPIMYNDGYMFVLTNDRFIFGQSWMTAIRFNNQIKESVAKKDLVIDYNLPGEDNTDLNIIQQIIENYTLVEPLENMVAIFEYDSRNDYNPHVSLAADLGTEIYAVSDGMVVKPEFSEYLGNYFFINHDDDFVTEYTHCSEILVENGDFVKAGDLVAKVGSTGRSTGSHLGFSAKYKGESINPILLFPNEKQN